MGRKKSDAGKGQTWAKAAASTARNKIIFEGGEEVRYNSPRLTRALKQRGVLWEQLQHKPIEHFSKDYAIAVHPAIAEKRFQVHEHMRHKKLAMVIKTRQQMVERADRAASCPPIVGATGNTSMNSTTNANTNASTDMNATSSLEMAMNEASSMIQLQQEKKKKFFEAAERRMEEEKQKAVEAKALANQRTEEHMRILKEFEKRQRDQQMEVQRRRAAAELHRLKREHKKAEELRLANIEARRVEAERIRKGELLDAARKRREAESREHSLAFAKKHKEKLQRISTLLHDKERERERIGQETARKMVESEKVRNRDLARLKLKVSKENRQRAELQAERLRRKLAADEQETENIYQEFQKRSSSVHSRLSEREEKLNKQIAVNRARNEGDAKNRQANKQKEDDRAAAARQEALQRAAEKQQAIEGAQQRRELQLQLRAEESHLKYMERQDHVQCQKRVEDYDRAQRARMVYEKDEKTNALLEAKRNMNEERRLNALQFIVKKQQMNDNKNPLVVFREKRDVARQIWPLAAPPAQASSGQRFSLGGAI